MASGHKSNNLGHLDPVSKHTNEGDQFLQLKIYFFLDVYDSKLKIHAHFSGLRYLMYYYPIFSSFLGASLIAVVISSIMAVAWLALLIGPL